MKKLMAGLMALALFASVGCYKQTFVNNSVTQEDAENPTFDSWSNNFLFGLVSGSAVDLNEICPDGVARIHEQETFASGLVTLLTLSLYNPISVTVHCADGTTKTIEATPAQ